jgi:type III secretory pathway lipoprotein EscJ
MELLIEADIVKQEQLVDLMEEANQILAIVIKSKITARKNQESEKNS